MNSHEQSAPGKGQVSFLTLPSSVIWAFAHLALCALCLVNWHSTHHWSHFDRFSSAYLIIKLLGSIQSLYSGREAFRSEALRQEWWGISSDANIVRWTQLLMIGDLLIFFDYGHWQTLRWLVVPSIQYFGLALYILAKLWQMWTDSYLAVHFADLNASQMRALMTRGPFHFLRHPRYAAVILGKFACAFIFASVFGWILAAAWALVYTRKTILEECHMRKLLGDEYREYAGKTARLIPGIY